MKRNDKRDAVKESFFLLVTFLILTVVILILLFILTSVLKYNELIFYFIGILIGVMFGIIYKDFWDEIKD